MIDCPNAEIRDRLPDLLHDRLSASERAMVMAHVDACAECRAELELLRGVQRTLMARTPRVDVGAIVAALPKPGARSRDASVVSIGERRRAPWSSWRAAAAITLLAVGAGAVSFAVARRGTAGVGSSNTSAVAERPAQRGDSTASSPDSFANRSVASSQAAAQPGSQPGSQPSSGRSGAPPPA
ncbi:MAG TPA: zf-HC2 domain-containing protein, partial [Gemmatimonadaceae bacterium]|nr:zf-HC2 domain-containing protein [Gemmatimonadaceae bacterium]